MTSLFFLLLCAIPNKYEITCAEKTVLVEPLRIELQDYVSLKPVAELLRLNYIMDHTTQQLHLTGDGRRFVLIPDVATVEYGGLYYHVPFAPVYRDGEVYFPVQLITMTLASAFERLVFIKSVTEIPPIERITLQSRGDSTVLKFGWPRSVDFDVRFSVRQAIVEVDGVYKGKRTIKPLGAVRSARLTPHNTYTSIEFDLEGVNSVIEREDEVVFYNKVSKQVRCVVIDAGHGGIDPGAVGKKGLYEKDANLAICRILKDLIEDSLKIKVVLTRDRDVYLSLKERTNEANRNAADIFVSVHCNAHSRGPMRSGFETFFLSEAKTSEERAVAALENASLRFDNLVMPDDDLGFILYDLAQSAFLDESNRLAENIQISAERSLKIPSRGVKQAGFYVLHGAFMPAVLVECAFISNPEEEKLLRQKDFQKKLALCIYRGIDDYIEDYERRLNN
ncbi:MAG: N-acetylmuramoyl-L-alanine amidase [candidate division WOR-3 bacterium]|nr:MAG: N-acetylmuramoyl-L-alanine amidase [candidate division WOR-3 bacterium]